MVQDAAQGEHGARRHRRRLDAKPAPKKPPLGLGDLPAECTAVLKAGGGEPVMAADGTVPAALKAEAGKDAGPPVPKLDPVALRGAQGRAREAGEVEARSEANAGGGIGRQPTPHRRSARLRDDPAVDNPSDDPISAGDPAVPLPDRKPQ